jgi:signal transduction histidine kinase
MVRKIIETHGGSVSFTCAEEGGTRFTVVLPGVPAMKEVSS